VACARTEVARGDRALARPPSSILENRIAGGARIGGDVGGRWRAPPIVRSTAIEWCARRRYHHLVRAARTSFEALDGKWALRTAATDFVQHLRLDTHAPGVLARDAWHRVTLIITRQSAPSVSDGVVLVWVNGALVIDLVGAVGTAPFTLATWPGAVTLDVASTRWVDDLAISTP
jgi:hypothetical protein